MSFNLKFSYEDNLNEFTRYINKKLRNDDRIENWSFYIQYDDKHELIVRIDYIYDFHSRDVFHFLTVNQEDLFEMFDYEFNRHIEELEGLVAKKYGIH